MRDLIERLERATGPDARLDGDIHEALGRGHVLEANKAEAWFVTETPSRVRQTRYPVPSYTASLDAALTLVPEGWMWDVSSSGCAWIMRDDDSFCDSQIVISGIGNPIIALCIAALKAREAAK